MAPKKKQQVKKEQAAEIAAQDRRAIAQAMCSSLSASVRDLQPQQAFHGSDVHCKVFRRLRLSIVTAAKLGHRSCHAVWGSSGSGKTQLLRLVADSLRKVPGMLVVPLDGGTLQGDDEAVRRFVSELRSFFQSSSASAFLAKHRSTIPQQLAELCDPPHEDGHSDLDGDEDGGGGSIALPKRPPLPHQALAVLQATLVAMNKGGVSMTILIDRATRFATWCDRLMYVLSGLMHEVDQRVGGMSLLLSSMCADMRGIEKRLSSRLTCEMWFLPRLQPSVVQLVDEAAKSSERLLLEASDRARQAAAKMEAAGVASRKRPREQQQQSSAWLQRHKEISEEADEYARLARIAARGQELVCARGKDEDQWLQADFTGLQEVQAHVLRAVVAFGDDDKCPSSAADLVSGQPLTISAAEAGCFGWSDEFVRSGYCSREVFLLLVACVVQTERGTMRTLEDLLSGIGTSLGSYQVGSRQDAFAMQLAFEQLVSCSMVTVQRRTQFVVLQGLTPARAFVSRVLASGELCELCGLDTKERHSLSQLFR